MTLKRTIDETVYYSRIAGGHIEARGEDDFLVRSQQGSNRKSDRLSLTVDYAQQPVSGALPAIDQTAQAVADHWQRFWTRGGAVDFSGSTDPRAAELERRVVLSQYLSAVNGAGELPPQEEGLFSNSWFGKFHLEMHPWHAAWQALWGHADLLERSLPLKYSQDFDPNTVTPEITKRIERVKATCDAEIACDWRSSSAVATSAAIKRR